MSVDYRCLYFETCNPSVDILAAGNLDVDKIARTPKKGDAEMDSIS
jgi:hypothetical protein